MYYISNIVFFIIYDRLYMYIYHEFHIPPGLRVFFVEGDGSLALPSSSFGTAPWRPFWGFMKYWNVRINISKLINNIHIYISFKYIYIYTIYKYICFLYIIQYTVYILYICGYPMRLTEWWLSSCSIHRMCTFVKPPLHPHRKNSPTTPMQNLGSWGNNLGPPYKVRL